MSLDNANPTVFQNAIGGGRTRFRDLFSSNTNKDSYDDFYHVGAGEITKPRTIPDVDFWSQLIGEVEYETPKREALPENDFIDAQEIYGKFFFFFLYMTDAIFHPPQSLLVFYTTISPASLVSC